MAAWVLRCFCTTHGRDDIDEWLGDLPARARARFIDAVTALRDKPHADWRRPYFARLHGKCTGLGEIQFDCMNVEYRPIGFFGPGDREYTLLMGAVEKGGQFEPSNACNTAQKRKDQVRKFKERSVACDF